MRGDIVVDVARHKVTLRGESLDLTPTEYNLLLYLMKNAGRTLSHRAILQHVWGTEYGEEAEYLRVYVGKLRQKIEADQALVTAQVAVSEITGSSDARIVPLKDEIPLIGPNPDNVDTWLKTAADNNLNIRVAKSSAEAAEQSLDAAWAGHYPTLQLVGTALDGEDNSVAPGVGGRIEQEYETTNVQLLLTVHDELVFEAVSGEGEGELTGELRLGASTGPAAVVVPLLLGTPLLTRLGPGGSEVASGPRPATFAWHAAALLLLAAPHYAGLTIGRDLTFDVVSNLQVGAVLLLSLPVGVMLACAITPGTWSRTWRHPFATIAIWLLGGRSSERRCAAMRRASPTASLNVRSTIRPPPMGWVSHTSSGRPVSCS